ncbi:MAG: hypothetical protein AAF548_18515 [Actinomycetota bacterium]
MTVGLLFTAFGLGLRHGIDWDHIAAIADLTGSSRDRREGWWRSLWYALGHAAAVFVLGVAAIAAGSAIPAGLDDAMGRIVGLTLVVLGVWLLVDLVRRRGDVRLRSRWMIVIEGTFRGIRRVRTRRGHREIHVDHEHGHEHDDDLAHDEVVAHDHAHLRVETAAPVPAGPPTVPPSTSHGHTHRHGHDMVLADAGGNGAAAGIGVLHGVGIESPTQIAIFVASTAAVGTGAGIALLAAWVVGLVVANGALALVAGWALIDERRAARVHRALAVVVGVSSLALGAFYLGAFG